MGPHGPHRLDNDIDPTMTLSKTLMTGERRTMWSAALKEGCLCPGKRLNLTSKLICTKQKQTKKRDKKSYPRPWQSVCDTCEQNSQFATHMERHMFSVCVSVFLYFCPEIKEENDC